MSGNLGDMQVSFSADISNLTSSVSQAMSQLTGFASAATNFSDQITQLFSTANVSDFTGQIDGATSSLTTLGTEVASTASSLQAMGPSANLSGFVSDIDVAQAQLVLLQSKAADAATALQEMQAAAAQSGDMSGLAEAQAQLVLLQGKAQDAAVALQELQVAESDTSGSSSFGDAVSGMMGNLGNFGSSIGSGISSLVSMGGELGMAVMGFQMLGNMAQQTASALLTPAATAETTQLSFTTLMHSASAAKDEMTALNTYAASTPMQTQWVDDAAAKILAFGGTTQQIIPEVNSIGDALSGLGKLSESSLNSIVDIFGKISATGRLTAGDMTQLATWGIPAWQALSDAMGKPIPVLQQMVSKGLLPAKDALPALQKGMEGIFGGGMAKQAQTFSGIISTISSDWQIAMSKLSGPLLKMAEDGLGKLSNILGSQQFQDFAANVGQKIADVLANIGNFVKNTLVPNFIAFGTYIGSLVPVVTPVFASIWSGLQQVGNFLQQTFVPVWQQLVNTFNNQLVPAWNNFYTSIQPIMPELETAAKWIGTVLVVAIGALVTSMAGWMKDSIIVFGGFVQMVGGAMTVAAGWIATFVDVVTGQWGKLNQDQVAVGNGWIAFWAGVWNNIVGIFGGAINGLIDQVNGWLSQTIGAFNTVSGAVGGPKISVGSIGHVGTVSVPKPVSVAGTQTPTKQQSGANPFAANQSNPFTQWLNSFNAAIASASASATTNTKQMSTGISSAVSNAADTTSAATTSGHTKTQAQIQKAADTANAQRLRLSADQQKALQDSSSSAVQKLVDKSKAAAAAGDTTTAAFYASQADQLAAQQKAAATKATNQKTAAAKKAARTKAAAAKKATTAKAVAARAAAKKKTATASTPKTSTRGSSTGTTTTRSTSTGVTPTHTGTGAISSTGGATLGTAATTVPQTLTFVLEINGKDFASVVMPFIMTEAMQKVRLKTGLKV